MKIPPKAFYTIFALTLLLFATQESKAYDKFLNNTSWYTGFSFHHPPLRPTWWHTIGDTTINAKSYIVVENDLTSWGHLYKMPKRIYLREDTIAKRVYYLDSAGTEYLWYRFDLNVGDSIKPQGFTNYIHVLDVDTIQSIWGPKRRTVFDTINYQFSIIEGVGWANGVDDFLRFHYPYPNTYWDWHWTSCIYKDGVQAWVFGYQETWGAQNYIPCQSMCPSIGVYDSLNTYDITICPGDSALLEGPCDSSYYWTSLSNPSLVIDTSNSIWVSPSVTTRYLWHGSMKTDTVVVKVRTPLTVNLGPDTSSCSNMTLTLKPQVSDTNVNYLWSTNKKTSSINTTTSGKYWVLIKDFYNCFNARDTLNYIALPTPVVTVDSFMVTNINSPYLFLTSGLPSQGTYYGNGVVNNTFFPGTAGLGLHTIQYAYTNGYGCSDTASMLILVTQTSGISNDTLSSNLTIYPNPNNGSFHLIIENDGELEIRNIAGKLLYISPLKAGQKSIQTDLTKGLYLLTFKTINTVSVSKLIVE